MTSTMKRCSLALLLTASLAACATAQEGPGAGATASQRNVILFLGDGMGISTITAARIFAGQQKGQTGEEYSLSFEHFPDLALIKTYNTNAQVPDSAGTMSAIMTGHKTRIGHISVAASVAHDDCAAALKAPLPTLLEMAADQGFATGVISTARLTHATPAATYAHVPNRDWENDAEVPEEARQAGCKDIAEQFVGFSHGHGIEVALAGGREEFLPDTATDPEYPEVKGLRTDGRNLIEEWQAAHPKGSYVWNEKAFDALPPQAAGPVLGLFEPSHMQYEADRAGDAAGEPSLAEMTAFAIRKLQQNPKGFFLMVEAGRIDHAHHAANARRALVDTVELSDAVQAAVNLVDSSNTLVLVTADHDHTLTISGYPRRGNPILGKVVEPDGHLATDSQGHPYTTLSYANGPGYQQPLPDLTDVDTEALDYHQLGTLPMEWETHSGADVAAFATGVGAGRVHGVMEQNRLFDVMHRALMPESGTTH